MKHQLNQANNQESVVQMRARLAISIRTINFVFELSLQQQQQVAREVNSMHSENKLSEFDD